jgi:hypothetical protein
LLGQHAGGRKIKFDGQAGIGCLEGFRHFAEGIGQAGGGADRQCVGAWRAGNEGQRSRSEEEQTDYTIVGTSGRDYRNGVTPA